MSLTIWNATRGVYLAERAERAASFWSRGVGLIGRRSLPDGYGLVIEPCRSVHMFLMRIPLDICHVDAQHRIIRVLSDIQPWRVGPIVWRSRYVVELPAGTARRTGTAAGDLIQLQPQ